MIKSLFLALCLFTAASLYGTEQPLIKFKENKTQWPSEVRFMGEFYNGKVFLENNAFVYEILDAEQLQASLKKQHARGEKEKTNSTVRGHVYKTVFVNAQPGTPAGENKQPEHYNYFLGQDQSKWSTGVNAFTTIHYPGLYNGIDLKAYSDGTHFKYDLLIAPFADAGQVRIKIEGADAVSLAGKDLHIGTYAGPIIEKAPVAWQLIKNKKQEVLCEYVLDGNCILFQFPNGYNKQYPLVIDPVVIACSFTGSTTYCNGEASDSDEQGNAYLAGSCLSQGFPATTGAFQSSLDSLYDMTFHKFNADGSTLLYATYIGGRNAEQSFCVHVVKNEAAIMGYTESDDFPVGSNAYDPSFNGMNDMVLLKFDTSGNTLIASTYLGGSATDATPGAWLSSNLRNFELLMDAAGNLFAVGATTSADFPVTASAYMSTPQGQYDGFACKLDPSLGNLLWSTYIGGTANDCLNGLRFDGSGGIYCIGNTTSYDFPVTPGVAQTSHLGVTIDICVIHLDATGSNLIASTYAGTTGADYGYLIDLDQYNNVYLYSLFYNANASGFTATPGAYNITNGKNIVYRLLPDLSQINLKARFGSSVYNNPGSFLCAAAFSVDSCGNIYIAGDAGSGFPVTPDALKATATGWDLYYCVLSKDATSLKYGSYFGGPNSEWATFGVCRMNNNGVMYYSFNGNKNTPVTANAWAASSMPPDPGNVNFDHGLLKVDLQTFLSATSYSSQLPNGCAPYTTTFTNQTPTSNIKWVFGDGSAPVYMNSQVTHTYAGTGTYEMLLIATDTSTCNNIDTLITKIYVYDAPHGNLPDSSDLCIAGSALLDAGNPGNTYLWSTGATTQVIAANQPGSYSVAVTNAGCTVSDTTEVILSKANYNITFPNIITPNNDGVNDRFDLSAFYVNEFDLHIFDRWGREVYSANNASSASAWDGNMKGKIIDGTYFYTLTYTTDCIKNMQETKGFITVIK